jgi:hypothetical protein
MRRVPRIREGHRQVRHAQPMGHARRHRGGRRIGLQQTRPRIPTRGRTVRDLETRRAVLAHAPERGPAHAERLRGESHERMRRLGDIARGHRDARELRECMTARVAGRRVVRRALRGERRAGDEVQRVGRRLRRGSHEPARDQQSVPSALVDRGARHAPRPSCPTVRRACRPGPRGGFTGPPCAIAGPFERLGHERPGS